MDNFTLIPDIIGLFYFNLKKAVFILSTLN